MSVKKINFKKSIARYLRKNSSAQAVAAAVVRSESPDAYDLVALAATHGSYDYESLYRLFNTEALGDLRKKIKKINPQWLLAVGRIVATLRGDQDRQTAVKYFDFVKLEHGYKAFGRGDKAFYFQLIAGLDKDRLSDLSKFNLRGAYSWALQVDVMNPFVEGGGSFEEWLDGFNSLFEVNHLEPISLSTGKEDPFDRLTAKPSSIVDDDEMVSVVMSSFKPDRGIVMAVNSILNQSWKNLELLVVDDASPEEYWDLLDEVADMDDRIRVFRMPANVGTYCVRNFALRKARGEYITFQDSDDWSHPRRLEYQVRPLKEDRELLATRSWCIRAYPNLTLTYLGYPPDRLNFSSLCLRRQVIDLIGYFDTVRKAADAEYPERIQALRPGSLLDLKEPVPLAVTKLRKDSLSRNDIIPGWTHWSRVAYRESFRAWHRRIHEGVDSPYYDGNSKSRRLLLPDPSWSPHSVSPEKRSVYDVVVMNDWRISRGEQPSVFDDIQAMIKLGYRVGVSQVETFDPPPKHTWRERMSRPIQELINDGLVRFIHTSQEYETKLLLVYEPAIFQLMPSSLPVLKVNNIAIMGGAASQWYQIVDCSETIEQLYLTRPLWLPSNSWERKKLNDWVKSHEIADFDWDKAVSRERLRIPVKRLVSGQPVVGFRANSWDDWPNTTEELLSVYPDDDKIDVRFRGDISRVRSLLRQETPTNWITYSVEQIDMRTFLAQLDFYVYFPGEGKNPAVENSVLEAIASGCVVILPRRYRDVYGDAAIYCDPEEVVGIAREMFASPEVFEKQRERADTWFDDNKDLQPFYRHISRLLG